jgi:hypothetical protein
MLRPSTCCGGSGSGTAPPPGDPQGAPGRRGRVENVVERSRCRLFEPQQLDALSVKERQSLERATRPLFSMPEELAAVHRPERDLRMHLVNASVRLREFGDVQYPPPKRMRLRRNP